MQEWREPFQRSFEIPAQSSLRTHPKSSGSPLRADSNSFSKFSVCRAFGVYSQLALHSFSTHAYISQRSSRIQSESCHLVPMRATSGTHSEHVRSSPVFIQNSFKHLPTSSLKQRATHCNAVRNSCGSIRRSITNLSEVARESISGCSHTCRVDT